MKAAKAARAAAKDIECPVCDSADCVSELRVSSTEAAFHFYPDPDSDSFVRLRRSMERLWKQDHVDFALCRDCGFGFAWPFVAGDSQLYAEAFERVAYPADKWDFRRAIEGISSHHMQPRRVLEMGPGFGFFIDRLVAHLPDRPEVVATEYGAEATAELERKGYDVHHGDVRSLKDPEPFDLICGFQVLEHMDDLDGLAKAFERLVKPGGHVMFTVPNIAHLSFTAAHGGLLDMPPIHVGRWSRDAFRIFGEKAGLELIEFDIEPVNMKNYVMSDIGGSYMRRTQRPRGLANWSRRQRTRPMGKAIGILAAAALAPTRLPVWLKAARRPDIGTSASALLRKSGEPARGSSGRRKRRAASQSA